MKLILAAAFICCMIQLGSTAGFETCDRSYHKVGCFKEKKTTMKLLINDRDIKSEAYEGHMLQWNKFAESIHSLACRCSVKAKAEGYSYFSIRFWAECYGGMDHAELDALVKNPAAASNQCANHQFQSCDVNVAEECVGKAATEYIYSLTQQAEESKDGNYTAWSEWTDCSNECGPGTQERERSCTNPEPLGAGADCESLGASTESKSCKVKDCPVDGGYTAWSKWTDCSEECGSGTQERKRSCTNPKPTGTGSDCQSLGSSTESKSCKVKECPVDGGYSAWGSCSNSCDGGWRSRTCNNPAPKHGGKACQGAAKEKCNTNGCAESCKDKNWWSSFDKKGWSTCGGTKYYMKGMWRNDSGGKKDRIGRIEEARCCKRSGSYGSESDDCYMKDWGKTLDKEKRWAKCGAGYFMTGMERSDGDEIHNIEKAKCCKPKSAPKSWGSCYDHNVGSSFDGKGWSQCNTGYHLTGLYRGTCDNLYCIEKFYCCKLKLKN